MACEVHNWMGVSMAVWAIVEFWLGKTTKIEAGSSLELILNLLRGLGKAIQSKQQK